MQTILAPIDFSSVSHRVIDVAVDLARVINGRVVLLNVVQPPAIASDLAPVVGETLKMTAEIERGARRHLHRLQSSLMKRGITVETACEQGASTSVIVSYARKLGARYIVLGSHGHSALYDLVVGSTASGVLKRAPCPIIVVPAKLLKKPRRQGTAGGKEKRPACVIHA